MYKAKPSIKCNVGFYTEEEMQLFGELARRFPLSRRAGLIRAAFVRGAKQLLEEAEALAQWRERPATTAMRETLGDDQLVDSLGDSWVASK